MRQAMYTCLLAIHGLLLGYGQAPERIVIDDDLQLIPIHDSIFLHLSWHRAEPYGRFSSNGMILIRNGKALMVDTPMDNEKTERLVVFLRDSLGVKLTTMIAGHFHDDCLGGLDYLHSIGVESIANTLTIDQCKKMGLAIPSKGFRESLTFDFHGEPLECRFFGGGHSFDNITVWLPQSKILFGGCLVRALESQGLGNIQDAVVAEWDTTVEEVLKAYPDIHVVIPGHGRAGGIELLEHTISLVKSVKESMER